MGIALVAVAAARGQTEPTTSPGGAIKVFILAGDDNLLEQAAISGSDARSLESVVAENPAYGFLKDKSGQWVQRHDVVLYDAHPIHNNTKTSGHFLQVGDVLYGGSKVLNAIGPELMFGHAMGEHYKEPILLIRFATRQSGDFLRGSRSLGQDFIPPSSGGTVDIQGGWDVIHFNFGVWDATYRSESDRFYHGRHVTSVTDYESNLRTLVARMKHTRATLIFANTTPVWKGDTGKENADVQAFNAVAKKVMDENGVIVDDLYAEVLRQGRPKSNNVHDVGNLAPKVTETILAALAKRQQTAKPLPRVLLIGDSITGTYQKQVMANLDGKAHVCKNPGNGEDTWNGLKRIDTWLDLKQYVLSGQEYLELVSNVRDALAHLDQVMPDYRGQKAELTGLVWFQGIKDTQSKSMTPVYEKHLVNLIKDLRVAFDAPKLPVVVGAISFGPTNSFPGTRAVHDAQMAVGDPTRYAEFAANVTSVDTTPFFPGPSHHYRDGYVFHYKGSSLSYLEIGRALAEGMLKMCEPEQGQPLDARQPEQKP